MENILEQLKLIAYFTLFGMFIATIYDIFRFFVSYYKANKVISYIIECLCWIMICFIACYYMLAVYDGNISIYTFLFYVIGILLHKKFLSNSFRKTLSKTCFYLKKIYRRFKKAIIIVVVPKEVFFFIGKNIRKIKIRKKKIKEEGSVVDEENLSV